MNTGWLLLVPRGHFLLPDDYDLFQLSIGISLLIQASTSSGSEHSFLTDVLSSNFVFQACSPEGPASTSFFADAVRWAVL